MQECGIGLVRVRRKGDRLAFAAPPLRRSGPVDGELRAKVLRALHVDDSVVRDVQWIDNGPPWIGVLLHDARAVLDLEPDLQALRGMAVGAAGAYPEGEPCAFEVRAFTPAGVEDPVTGSLNAGFAMWLIGDGIAPSQYVASQGAALRRRGRVYVERIGPDTWVGGDVRVVTDGTITL